ncbi:nitrate reductase molybdenum cofactor assembly chaperone [Nocardia sp. NPDC005978]|uniref:nitrate reductase molybdenum cofactor assembly chaperone n=1 Tax=Nocardia sp. NPDC005978 TaxID=3156725 RepID=UPI0033AA526B
MKLSESVRAGAFQVQSLLLAYPDESVRDSLPMLRRAAATLPAPIGAPLRPLLNHLENTDPVELAIEFVDTFDHRKRFSPYLTWFLYGDTRKRGMALLRFKQLYRASGLLLEDGELSDHLAVVLEFASAHPAPGQELLEEHRAGIEVMRRALREAESPWAGALDSVSATLSPLRGDEQAAVDRLIAAGPPGEDVGLEPFAPPTYMPQVIGGRR